jgi:hypothetical protein
MYPYRPTREIIETLLTALKDAPFNVRATVFVLLADNEEIRKGVSPVGSSQDFLNWLRDWPNNANLDDREMKRRLNFVVSSREVRVLPEVREAFPPDPRDDSDEQERVSPASPQKIQTRGETPQTTTEQHRRGQQRPPESSSGISQK